ncbi:hypothetical protein KQ313_02185 [Synechococcus sp. CS-1325]|uniref:hypothetical protein n=1 Tax=unclassified Synechococcus TaxID=2626047 RepID=UPI000DB7E07B|nr:MULTISPECIES: hypothetical protein [unclassified Synechococcus]PZV01770.1 MAG: hypothetical protein DCF24_03625 [Cyanobium sp.]MCT0198497.1 hypothetical protein [Synechococcus sp. CS-1325]MCT0212823.1 hypothetical protein [Synechococcus sp. CS-1326]MCT0229863.1 hypothetical protein [Synechococcus sp. CS-1324]MCT0232867.1 hypothetical protein [Synechococcus sp. CS-1327]
MEAFFGIAYFICFAVIAGGAFALMRQNLQATDWSSRTPAASSHPEAPSPGDQLLYVDLNRERLERLLEETA